jgi:hypothetical protein
MEVKSLFDDGTVYDNITYPETCEVDMKNGKPVDTWMKNWTIEQRLDKFFEFCEKFDRREDRLLKEDYQIFSHRLHWHEHPFCDIMKDVEDPMKRLWYTLVFSFTNEHWGTLTKLMKEGEDALREHFKENRHARNDLFQIYFPKGTNVKEWIIEGPKRAAEDMHHILEGVNKPYTMMKFAKILESYFKENQGFRSPLYPCKNTARYIAMAYPHLVDPESILFGGTGHFDGLHQIFGGKNLNGKVKYEIDEEGNFLPINEQAREWVRQMDLLVNHPKNPMVSQKYLNVEDKTCFFWKHIAITHGEKRPTKRIPYTWIFPKEFSLKK